MASLIVLTLAHALCAASSPPRVLAFAARASLYRYLEACAFGHFSSCQLVVVVAGVMQCS